MDLEAMNVRFEGNSDIVGKKFGECIVDKTSPFKIAKHLFPVYKVELMRNRL